MALHRARSVWTPDGLRPDTVVEVDGTGAVVAVRPARAGDPPALDGWIVPGLVNAHAHLELSFARGQGPGGQGFVPWVQGLSPSLRTPPADRGTAAAAADAVRLGTAGLCDISNGGDTAGAMGAAGLAGIVQHELLGFGRDTLDARLALADAPVRRRGAVAVRPTPHAIFSTHPELLARAAAPRGGVPASIHLAEDPGEAQWLADGTGPHAGLLDAIGVDWRWFAPPGGTPAAWLDRLGVLGPDLMVVHGVHLGAADRALLGARRAPLCLCLRSNLHIGGQVPDVPALVAAGVSLALGTDSLASCPDLDVLGEVAVGLARFPDLDPAVWLHAATGGGADALRLPQLGRLVAGARPGLLWLEGVRGWRDLAEPPPRHWLVGPTRNAPLG